MIDPPSARLPEDGAIDNPDVPGYEPDRITVSGGIMSLDAAKGIAYVNPATSAETNSQINTLGVAFDAASGAFDIETTVINPYQDGTNDSEQAGIWFGLDEDNFVKLVAANNGQIELRSELNAASTDADQQVVNGIAGLGTSNVSLRLHVDPVGLVMEAFYTIGGSIETSLGTLPVPASYINGATVDGQNVSFAGLFASKRREEATTVINYQFEDFSITPDGPSGDLPFFSDVNPANNATNVAIQDFQITVSVNTPTGYELDETTLSGNVKLFEQTPSGEVEIPSNSNDTGGGDAITLTPTESLKPLTSYIFRINGVEANLIGDVSDRLTFEDFESRFTTGQGDDTPPVDLTGVSFTKVQGTALGDGIVDRFTSLVIG
ncbi:MAG: Ig-like domain-containing protein, partial [Cyclobacteriaceae bacterium]